MVVTGPLSPQQHHNITHWLASQGIAQDPHHTAEMYVTMCTNPRVSSMLLRVLDKEELRELVWRKSHSQPAANKIILGKTFSVCVCVFVCVVTSWMSYNIQCSHSHSLSHSPTHPLITSNVHVYIILCYHDRQARHCSTASFSTTKL